MTATPLSNPFPPPAPAPAPSNRSSIHCSTPRSARLGSSSIREPHRIQYACANHPEFVSLASKIRALCPDSHFPSLRPLLTSILLG